MCTHLQLFRRLVTRDKFLNTDLFIYKERDKEENIRTCRMNCNRIAVFVGYKSYGHNFDQQILSSEYKCFENCHKF